MGSGERTGGRGQSRSGRHSRENTTDKHDSVGDQSHGHEITQNSQTSRTTFNSGVASGDAGWKDNETQEETFQRHTSRTQKVGTTEKTRERNRSPPPAPTTLTSRQSVAFRVNPTVEDYIKIKLAIESPLKGGKHSNDVAFFFKRFMVVLMAANSDIELLEWEKTTENPIAKAIDIAYDEDNISRYYSGMKMKSDQKRMVGFTCIYSPLKFE